MIMQFYDGEIPTKSVIFLHFFLILKIIIFSLTSIIKSCQNLCLKSHLSESFDVPAGWGRVHMTVIDRICALS